MVTQPAYIANLKKYARARVGDETDIDASVADLHNESDRGAIILASTSIEDMLEYEIFKRLPGLFKDDAMRRKIFESDGLLASFSKKIEMAYALGIIDGDYKKKIDLIREIRNACAHSRKPLAMDKEVLQEPCRIIISDFIDDIKDKEPKTIRMAFICKCAIICHYIATGEKIEGTEAQLKHFAKIQKDLNI